MPMPAEQPAATARPDHGTVAVGTPETLAGAIRQLEGATSETLGRPFGVIVLDETARRSAESIGMRVLGTVDELPDIHRRTPFSTAIVSFPRAMNLASTRVREALRAIGAETRFIPTIDDLLRAPTESNANESGGFDIQSLIGRSPKPIDRETVSRAITGKRVVITGAGGSIGSEIARICAQYEPAEIILIERAENALFEIDSELGRRSPDIPRRAILHDVVEAEGTLRRFLEVRPDVIFHAAAHKHVPMMEDHPGAALNNNLFGTKSVADAARASGCERFVLISTDKAVNPSSVMGATKRLAELYIQSLNGLDGCTFSLVRFGNVLGSACSVLPIWTRQLSEGGPITVTHEEMTRYFMTIPEAASLVIQTSTLGGGRATGGIAGGIFELDMGDAVKIRDLAERFIRLHGFEPQFENEATDLDSARPTNRTFVRVRFTGIRPGEKLHEELAYQAEDLRPTSVPGVLSWSGETPQSEWVAQMVSELTAIRRASGNEAVLEAITRFVPSIGRGPAQPSGVCQAGGATKKDDAIGAA